MSFLIWSHDPDSTMDLLDAAAKGDVEAVRQVVSQKPFGSKGHDQAMQRAVQYGQTEVLQELLHVSMLILLMTPPPRPQCVRSPPCTTWQPFKSTPIFFFFFFNSIAIYKLYK